MFSVGVQHSGYLLGIVTGKGELADFCGAAMMIAEVARRSGERRVLVDLLGAEPQLAPEQHQELGEFLGRAWAGLQVASVVPSVERIGVSEAAAQAMGLRLRTFTALAEAQAWLNGD